MKSLPGKPATVLAWHPSQGAGSDRLEPRGASSIKSTVDSNLTIWRDDDRITLSHTKIRGEHFEPIEGRISTVDLQAASGRRYSCPVVTLDAPDVIERSDAREAREAILRHLLTASAPNMRDLANVIGKSTSTVWGHLQHVTTAKLVGKDAVDDCYALTKIGRDRAKAIAERSREAYQDARDPG